jgi:hypothetical protein
VTSLHSDLQTPALMISDRGALTSGMAVPSMDSDDEIEFDGDDLENGPEPPDSDYASHVPPQLFTKTILQRKVSLPKRNIVNVKYIYIYWTKSKIHS